MENTDHRVAQTSAPILGVLAQRWSPRSFDSTVTIDEKVLTSALEAARWSASAANTQPWRLVVTRRGTSEFDTIVAALMGFNTTWASSAAVLIVAIAETIDGDGKPLRWAEYDLGQAMAHLSVQAHSDGLHVHQMGGIFVDKLSEAFHLDARFVPVSAVALGVLGSPDLLDEKARERELAPRSRRPLDGTILVNA
ncbi:nitroreductase family protein [Frigoribacterium sp. CG_9.8]|uniref:nitroreductase family protein n=1 Tax=Frigoribacterium sp. CG_9.8 TaxID=2787733 RepID=UPI0018C9F91F|nr:nitroreductase family protein [Frigoribacterium sp. CG_9.8]MBG6106659.1 nitroreductase [Frigoribacterium sp. CG_9.8]